jgi:NAD-dependent SIR2 family protein deacetylase
MAIPAATPHIPPMDVHDRLREFLRRHERLFVLTGAGCSTRSGIPDYRDADGSWKRGQPMTFQAFTGTEAARQRYWARSLAGWPRIAAARPNRAHAALARLEARGAVELLLTQNVDGLHQAAGSRRVVELHGGLDRVRCLGCGRTTGRAAMQAELVRLNPGWSGLAAAAAPDGDSELEGRDTGGFVVPPCPACGGVLKPDVVFFGENVPKDRVEDAFAALGRADALLVIGSSLTVYSGFRFAAAAAAAGKPIAAVNLGRTRADHLLALKAEAECGEALSFLLDG